jgi:hypothetical protein
MSKGPWLFTEENDFAFPSQMIFSGLSILTDSNWSIFRILLPELGICLILRESGVT